MDKSEKNYNTDSFHNVAAFYADATTRIGLWQSEQYAFEKYFSFQLMIRSSILAVELAGRPLLCIIEATTILLAWTYHLPCLQGARIIAQRQSLSIPFIQGDATSLPFPKVSFNKALFSFNSLMQIPQRKNRIQALQEINRILTDDGVFIFTTATATNITSTFGSRKANKTNDFTSSVTSILLENRILRKRSSIFLAKTN